MHVSLPAVDIVQQENLHVSKGWQFTELGIQEDNEVGTIHKAVYCRTNASVSESQLTLCAKPFVHFFKVQLKNFDLLCNNISSGQ